MSGIVKDITIEDARQNVVTRNIKIPRGTFPGMKDEIAQTLSETTLQIIKGEINKQFNTKTDREYLINLKLNKGIIGFKANAFNEMEYTDVEIEITAIDQNNKEIKCSSKVSLEIKSLDASPEYLFILFNRTITNAIHKCFGELN